MSSPGTAPLDTAAVARARQAFGHSRMLPGSAYVDAAVAAWEAEHFFEGSWVCVGRGADLAHVGEQRAVQIGRTGVLLVRGGDGALHAYANICRHRGHELLPCGAATVRGRVVCPYHAWSYALDGSLQNAPRFGAVTLDDASLVRLRHHEWGGWVFVNAGGDGPAFEAHVGALSELLEHWPLDRMVPMASHTYELAADWKLVHENYHECYHCPSIHPELCRVSGHDSGQNLHGRDGAWVGGTMDLHPHAITMSIDGASAGRVIDTLSERQRRTVTYVGLFPNLLISAHPDYVITHRMEPLGPGRCRVECSWLFADAGVDPAYAVDFWDVVNRQDWAAVESVQRSLASPAYVPGVLGPHEDAVHAFVTMVARGYSGLPLTAGGSA